MPNTKTKRPLIGITCKDMTDASRAQSDQLIYAVSSHFPRAIRRVGGGSVIIPLMNEPDCLLSLADLRHLYHHLDGLILTGGNDVNPGLYGQSPHPTTDPWSDRRDTTESHLIKWAKQDNKPLLAICRGMQLFNVTLGGSLKQNIGEQPINHLNDYKPLEERIHPIRISSESRLHQALEHFKQNIKGDSHHHQAVDGLGEGLTAVGWAEDGVIEAIEPTDPIWYAIGVQWHPEIMGDEHSGLFESFVKAARATNPA